MFMYRVKFMGQFRGPYNSIEEMEEYFAKIDLFCIEIGKRYESADGSFIAEILPYDPELVAQEGCLLFAPL